MTPCSGADATALYTRVRLPLRSAPRAPPRSSVARAPSAARRLEAAREVCWVVASLAVSLCLVIADSPEGPESGRCVWICVSACFRCYVNKRYKRSQVQEFVGSWITGTVPVQY